MSLTYQSMTLPPFLSENLSPNDTMTDIRFWSEALNARCIAAEDADIVEHGCLFQELHVKSQFWVSLRYFQATIGHLPTVY